MNRYHRQILLQGIGEKGQRLIRESHALVVGCGALGTMIVDSLARAGIGTLTIVDRDVVEITNLQRQILFDERDVADGMPKAEAAKNKIARINSEVRVNAHVDDFNHRNAEKYAADADIIMDGLDNFETRYLLNDLAVSRGLPYIYGGAVATTGVSMAVLPHPRMRRIKSGGATRQVGYESKVKWEAQQSTPCLRCVFPEAPPPGTSPTCDTAGVLAPAVAIIAAHQVTQAIKLLTGNIEALDRSLYSIDVWANDTRRFDVRGARSESCPCCGQGRFEFLEGSSAGATTSLCGRNAVQITPATASGGHLNLAEIAGRLSPHGRFSHNKFLLRGEFHSERSPQREPIELTLFPNGRAIIKGTTEPEVARSIYAKYVGA